MKRIRLGKLKKDAGTNAADGETIYLTKHQWDCDWYWAFGYIGNDNWHFHFETLLDVRDTRNSVKYLASEVFEQTNISDVDWWVIRDLFIQAYALKHAAAVYRHGGYQSNRHGVTDIIKDNALEHRLNADLKKVLDTLWDFIQEAAKEKKVTQ